MKERKDERKKDKKKEGMKQNQMGQMKGACLSYAGDK